MASWEKMVLLWPTLSKFVFVQMFSRQLNCSPGTAPAAAFFVCCHSLRFCGDFLSDRPTRAVMPLRFSFSFLVEAVLSIKLFFFVGPKSYIYFMFSP